MLTWVDLIIVLIIGLFAVWGWQRGLLFVVIELVGVALSLVIALLAYGYVAPLLTGFARKPGLEKVFAFVAVFLVVNAVYWLAARLVMKRAAKRGRRRTRANSVLGCLLGAAQGVAMSAAAMIALVTLPGSVNREALEKSTLGPPMLQLGSAIDRAVTAAVPEDIKEGLTFITITPDSKERIAVPPQTDVRFDPGAESQMLVLLNKERTRRGLRPLKMSVALRGVARDHSKDMFLRGYFGHVTPDGLTPFNRISLARIRYEVAGENLALAPTTKIAHEGLMDSPGHKENILSPEYGKIGIGVSASRSDGKMFTQVFSN